MRRLLGVGVLLAVASVPSAAWAQTPTVEVGASLASAVIGVGDNDNGSVFGIPGVLYGGGMVNPGAYASLFVMPRLAIEPQVGLFVASFDGDTYHVVNVVGQVNYFFTDVGSPAAYVFGSAGIVDVSGEGPSPKSLSAGLGYRVPVGENLSFRVDGRYTRFMIDDLDSNSIAFTFSIGGLLGRR